MIGADRRTAEAMESWEDIDIADFECKICHGSNKIAILACEHKVCERCLAEIRRQAVRSKCTDALKCPYCRRRIETRGQAWQSAD